jgi:hypothetical protein
VVVVVVSQELHKTGHTSTTGVRLQSSHSTGHALRTSAPTDSDKQDAGGTTTHEGASMHSSTTSPLHPTVKVLHSSGSAFPLHVLIGHA